MDWIILIYLIVFFFGYFFLTIFLLLHFRHKNQLFSYPIPKRFPSLTFLVPAYNEEESIEETVNALI